MKRTLFTLFVIAIFAPLISCGCSDDSSGGGGGGPDIGTIPTHKTGVGALFTLDLAPYVTDANDNDSSLVFAVTSGGGSFNGSEYTNTFSAPPGLKTVEFSVTNTKNKTSNGSFQVCVYQVTAQYLGDTGEDWINDVAMDGQGNVYLCGAFSGSVDFGTAFGCASGDLKNSSGSSWYDGFVTKLDADGVYQWTKRVGGDSDDSFTFMDIDENNNVYVQMSFRGTIDFAEDWSETDSKTSAGGYEVAVMRIDADGSYGWTVRIGGGGKDATGALYADGNGHVFAGGSFSGTVDFGADAGGTDSKTAVSGEDAYLTMLFDNGSYGWTRVYGNTQNLRTYGITTDSAGNAIAAGSFTGSLNFAADWSDNDTLVPTGGSDIFVTAVGTDGSYAGTKLIGGEGNESIRYLSCDSSDNLYLAGGFENNVDFGSPWGGADLKNSAGSYDAFVTSFTTAGTYNFTRTFGGTGYDYAYSAVVGPEGYVAVGGIFSDTINLTADFSGENAANFTSLGGYDVFVARITSAGGYFWGMRMGGTGNVNNPRIAADPTGNVYVGGHFTGSIDLLYDWTGDPQTSEGGSDGYLLHVDFGG